MIILPEERVDEISVDPYIELAVLEAAELAVDTSIEAILVAEERIDEFSVDPLIEATQAADRVSEEANEIIVIDSITETIIEKIAEEASDDNTIDPSIELAVLKAVDRIVEEADEDIVEKNCQQFKY